MRYILSLIFLVSIAEHTFGQKKIIQNIKSSVTALESEAHLSFLASNEMRGRDTGSPEIDIAANYIKTQLKIAGAKPVQGDTTFFQEVQLEKIIPATDVSLTIGTDVFKFKDDLLHISGTSAVLEGEMVFVGYGSVADFEKVDVKGKVVVALAGSNATTNAVQALLTDSPAKSKVAAAHGAAALIEIMLLPGLPWQSLVNFLAAERMVTHKPQTSIAHLYMKKSDVASITSLMETKKSNGKLEIQAKGPVAVPAKNVAGVIEGSDASLKNEWIVISAHYDHVGVKHNPSKPDSIFNGARDNAIGTVGLLHAAKFFGANRPKRSILFLALTGEEKGLLGSEWYSNHPLIPLKQTVFNYNTDGAGYNDKTIVTVIDFNRTTVDELLKNATEAFGLTLKGDPAPEQNLYERSDNLNFAVKGVPAVDFAPGIKAFDKELFQYYHQPEDEVNSLDMAYIEKFHRSFVYGAYLIANSKDKPAWVKGDKFEEAGKKLYGGN